MILMLLGAAYCWVQHTRLIAGTIVAAGTLHQAFVQQHSKSKQACWQGMQSGFNALQEHFIMLSHTSKSLSSCCFLVPLRLGLGESSSAASPSSSSESNTCCIICIRTIHVGVQA
jgi:hypothetical protein